MAALSLPIVHAQSTESLAEKLVAAGDAERVEMAAAHPEFRDAAFRRVLSTRGIESARRGDFSVGERYHNALLWLGNYFKDDAIRAVALIGLTSLNGQRGDYAAAQRYAGDALRLAEQENDLESIQSALGNLGIVQRRLGDPEGALLTFDRAFNLAQKLQLNENAARVLNNIGLAYWDLGNMAAAREYLDRSLAMKAQLEQTTAVVQDIARSLNNIGILYDEQGDYPQSLDYYQRALAMLQGSGGGPSVTTSVSNIGHVYLKQGDYGRAREQFNRAMELATALGDKPRTATILYLLGMLDREAGRYAEAEATQRRSLAIREETGESMPLVESLTELSSLALAGGRASEADTLARRAVTIATAGRLPSRLWKAQTAAADALAAMHKDDEAIAQYLAAVDGIETLRQLTVGGDRGRQMYLGHRIGPYYGLARTHADAGRPFDALLAVERARARTLLDVLGAGRHASRLLSGEQRQRERELTQAVVSAASEIEILQSRPAYDRAQLTALEAKLLRARLDRDAYTAALYASTPDLRIARGDAPVITRDDLNVLVTPATAIVSLVLDEATVWAYVITRNSAGVTVTARRIPATSVEFAGLADRFATQVATRDLGFAANARKLYDVLFVASGIEPMLSGKSQLVIVPDGPLWRVPFQALQTPRNKFLIEERAVAYAPSVSALASLMRRSQSRAARDPYLLALGDPAVAAAAGRQTYAGRKVERLPLAAKEVTALGRLYGGTKSRVLVGENATEDALRDNLGRATVVHVATHGIFDDLSPMYSHLMLTPAPGTNSGSDGRLEAWELMEHQMNVDLAVLSACETARGPVGDGEGVLGLSWSLFAAGASAAMVSQWEVDSASTTELMIAFHEILLSPAGRGGARVAAPDALRGAAIRLLRGGDYRHPFYWAGFVVIGAP